MFGIQPSQSFLSNYYKPNATQSPNLIQPSFDISEFIRKLIQQQQPGLMQPSSGGFTQSMNGGFGSNYPMQIGGRQIFT